MLIFLCITVLKILDKQVPDEYNKIISLKLNFKSSHLVKKIENFLATGDCVRARQNAVIFASFVKFSLEVR